MAKKRLYQILRLAGVINTKKEAMKLLQEGRVKVDGVVTQKAEFQVDPDKKEVTLDDEKLVLQEHFYFALNKPRKYLSHRQRSFGKKHLLELINEQKAIKNSINPVGRLDYESRGLIILTNDGDFADKLLQPATKKEKEYEVYVKGELTDAILERLRNGVDIEIEGDKRKNEPKKFTYTTKPCKIKVVERTNQYTIIRIVLTEGKKRQIRAMIASEGFKVLDLNRIRIGKLTLGDLKEGEYKAITKDDVL